MRAVDAGTWISDLQARQLKSIPYFRDHFPKADPEEVKRFFTTKERVSIPKAIIAAEKDAIYAIMTDAPMQVREIARLVGMPVDNVRKRLQYMSVSNLSYGRWQKNG